MLTPRTDRIADAVRLLAAGVAVATDPTLLSALKTAPSIYDTVRKLAAAPPSSVGRLAETLAGEARATFAATRDLPPFADELYVQMVEIGMVGAPEIVAAGMDAGAVAEAMLGKLSDPEHRSGSMAGLFRALTVPVLERLLADKAFAADLTPAFMREVLGQFAGLGARLDRLDRLTRLEMEALANRFEIERIFALTDDELREALEKRAEDWRALRGEVEALRGTTPRIDNVLAEVEAALERVDLAEAEALLASIRETAAEVLRKPLEDIARIMEAQARVALLRGAAEEAFTILSAAADSFAALDPVEPARRRLDYEDRLYAHGMRYGGTGLKRSESMIREALGHLSEQTTPALWAKAQHRLGNALLQQGQRLEFAVGLGMLRDAEEAFRAALRVRTADASPGDWAGTQNSLGVALQMQADRFGEKAGAGQVGEAIAGYRDALRNEAAVHYRAALSVWTEGEAPAAWAGTSNNLGNLLNAAGCDLPGAAGTKMLGDAITVYRTLERVWTEAEYPVNWTMAQKNLGIALKAQGERVGGDAGARMLAEAVDAYRTSLRVLTQALYPVDWAGTMENLGSAQEALSDNPACVNPQVALLEAVRSYEAALQIYDEGSMPNAHGRASEALARVRRKLAALGGDSA